MPQLPTAVATVYVTLGGGKSLGITKTNELILQDDHDLDGTFILLGDATKENLRRLQANIGRLEVHCTD